MPSVEARLAKLENASSGAGEYCELDEFIRRLPELDAQGNLNWHPKAQAILRPMLTRLGDRQPLFRRLLDPIDRGLATLIELRVNSNAPFFLENLRDRVPDRVLSAIYNTMRNNAFRPEVRERVRKLAGVIDDSGKPMPGYAFRDNGSIVEAEVIGHV